MLLAPISIDSDLPAYARQDFSRPSASRSRAWEPASCWRDWARPTERGVCCTAST